MSEAAHEDAAFEDLTIPEQLAAIHQRLGILENEVVEVVREVAGNIAAATAKSLVDEAVAGLTELVTAAQSKADHGGAIVDAFAHAKIGAVANAVQRAIGVEIPMPDYAGAAAGEPKVTGAETASQLEAGK